MIAVARTADLVIMVLDACKKDIHKEILTQEMESVGIRLNQKRPDIYFKEKKGGGLSFNSTVPLTHMDEKAVRLILGEYKIHNAEVLFREDATADQFIDAILGTRIYMKCIYVYNKIDQISLEEVDRLARGEHNVVISCNMKLNLDYLVEVLWEELKLIRIYTKKPGHPPDFDDGIIFRSGITVKNVCDGIHRFGLPNICIAFPKSFLNHYRYCFDFFFPSELWPPTSSTLWPGAGAPSSVLKGWGSPTRWRTKM